MEWLKHLWSIWALGSPQWPSGHCVITKCSGGAWRISLHHGVSSSNILWSCPHVHASSHWTTTLRAGVRKVHGPSLGVGTGGNLHSSGVKAWTHMATQVMVCCNPIALVCEFWWADGGMASCKVLYSRPHVLTAFSIGAKLPKDIRPHHISWATLGWKQIHEQKHVFLRVSCDSPLGEQGMTYLPIFDAKQTRARWLLYNHAMQMLKTKFIFIECILIDTYKMKVKGM